MTIRVCFFFIAFATIISSCGNAATNSNGKIDYAHLATAYCDCAQRSIDLNIQMRRLFEADRSEEISQLIGQVDKEFQNALSCCKKAKDGQTRVALDQDKFEGKLRQECSEMPPKLIEELLKGN